MLDGKGKLSSLVCVLIFMTLASQVAYAKTQYVTDILYITLRTGPGDSFKVLRVMKTATKLEVIEENEDGYSLVRTEAGEEGWARTKYLVDDPVASIKLTQSNDALTNMTKNNESLKKENADFRKKVKELEKDRKRLESTNTNLINENKKMKKISAKPIALAKENDELKSLNEANESQIAQLSKENKEYKENTGRNWFLAGGGVLFFGIILGLVLPSIRWRKNKGWA